MFQRKRAPPCCTVRQNLDWYKETCDIGQNLGDTKAKDYVLISKEIKAYCCICHKSSWAINPFQCRRIDCLLAKWMTPYQQKEKNNEIKHMPGKLEETIKPTNCLTLQTYLPG